MRDQPLPHRDPVSATGGDVVVAGLRRSGVDAVFALHGAQIDPIFQAARRHAVRLVDVRHEATAGFAAEAYARCGRPFGVAALCPGPGFTNVLTSIANAATDRTRVLYLVGSPPAAVFHSNGLQTGMDHLAVASPLLTWGASVTSIEQLAPTLNEAFGRLTSGPAGPVLLDLAADVLAGATATVTDGEATPSGHAAPGGDGPVTAHEQLETCLRALEDASRPVIILGRRPEGAAGAALISLISRTGAPCFSAYEALGVFDDGDEVHGGHLFQLGRVIPQLRPDLAVVVSQPLGFDTPGLRDGGAQWGVQVISIDDHSALLALDTMAATRPPIDRTAWRQLVRNALRDQRAMVDARRAASSARVHPAAAGAAVSDAAARHEAVVVGDGAVCKHWLHEVLRIPRGGRYLTHGRFGCMGMGSGLAIGAAIATGRPVVNVTGDGALGFALGELEAIARHALPIVTVVMNNARWGASVGFQLRHHGPDGVIATELGDAAYERVAAAFEMPGTRAESVGALAEQLEQMLTDGRGGCINVMLDVTPAEDALAPELPLLMSSP